MKEIESDRNYSDAVSQGHYQVYTGGLLGKHDNVRTYWEDQMRNIRLRPHLTKLVNYKKKLGKKMRICDLGAGSGEGLRLLTSANRAEEDLGTHQTKVLPYEMIERYTGSDLSEAMVEQGNENFVEFPNVVFKQGDFSNGFPHKDEDPFDLYYCTYGSFSHIDDNSLELLLSEIAEHAPERAIVVGDWLGRQSVEWPKYWGEPGEQMLDYTMNWLPGKEDDEESHFPMRYWLGSELRDLVDRVSKNTKIRINILDLYDCSVFTGRHVDTNHFGACVNSVRSAVNRLHEENVRTDLETVKVRFTPVDGQDEVNGYYARLAYCWNNLVDYCQKRLAKRVSPVQVHGWNAFPSALQMAIMTLDRVIDAVAWMRMGDPRANIIEPQLGYALRTLEMEHQMGLGRGHALVGIFEIRKDT